MKRIRNGHGFMLAGFFVVEPFAGLPRMPQSLMDLLRRSRARHASFASTLNDRDYWKDSHLWMVR